MPKPDVLHLEPGRAYKLTGKFFAPSEDKIRIRERMLKAISEDHRDGDVVTFFPHPLLVGAEPMDSVTRNSLLFDFNNGRDVWLSRVLIDPIVIDKHRNIARVIGHFRPAALSRPFCVEGTERIWGVWRGYVEAEINHRVMSGSVTFLPVLGEQTQPVDVPPAVSIDRQQLP